ncbi:hypothetical protein TW89_1622 [Neisseria flavescens]|nr:hypothetical protein TW89_1622 [Neisseria flavescens]
MRKIWFFKSGTSSHLVLFLNDKINFLYRFSDGLLALSF